MKLLIVGLGSMGKRRARLTKGIDAAIQIVGVDTAEGRRDEALRLGLADAAYATIGKAVAAGTPLRREGNAPEVAQTVAFLASDAAGFITGVNLDVNGGTFFS